MDAVRDGAQRPPADPAVVEVGDEGHSPPTSDAAYGATKDAKMSVGFVLETVCA